MDENSDGTSGKDGEDGAQHRLDGVVDQAHPSPEVLASSVWTREIS